MCCLNSIHGDYLYSLRKIAQPWQKWPWHILRHVSIQFILFHCVFFSGLLFRKFTCNLYYSPYGGILFLIISGHSISTSLTKKVQCIEWVTYQAIMSIFEWSGLNIGPILFEIWPNSSDGELYTFLEEFIMLFEFIPDLKVPSICHITYVLCFSPQDPYTSSEWNKQINYFDVKQD